MTLDRERVRAVVREELARRLASAPRSHPAFFEIHIEVECTDDPDFPTRRPCVIEPDKPCYNSGYCRRLGY
jgi:hypothetical protein